MIVLELRFLAGRYHATPWGRHVNEGAVEWPPSPWRIVRALIATWYLKARRDEEISEHTIRALADALLSQPPVFRLPRATTAHTRHYMPINKGKMTTKVFDTFVQLSERDAIFVAWDVVLPPQQLAALQTLAGRLGYFGRAESLVEARVLEGITAIEPNAVPLTEGALLPAKTELVSPARADDASRLRDMAHRFSPPRTAPPANGKRATRKKAKAPGSPSTRSFHRAPRRHWRTPSRRLESSAWCTLCELHPPRKCLRSRDPLGVRRAQGRCPSQPAMPW